MGEQTQCIDPGNCKVSSGIHNDEDWTGLTFGSGELDFYRYWEKPCWHCARENEKQYPQHGPCWPFKPEDMLKLDDED
jgi:hypothetical protein